VTICHCSVCDTELKIEKIERYVSGWKDPRLDPKEWTQDNKGAFTFSIDPCTTCLDEEYTKGLEADFVA